MIQAGDLLLVAGEGALSKAIERFSDSPYSHAAIALRVDGDEVDIWQAWTFGTEIVPLECALGKFSGPVDVFRPVELPDLAAGRKLARSMVSRGYDFFGLFRLAWAILSGRRKATANRKTTRTFCSEDAQIFYRACGVKATDLPDQMVEPGDLGRSKAFVYAGTIGIDV